MATDSHGGQPPLHGPTHGLPYEPDQFSVKPILMVPFAVIATGIVAFITTTLIFDNIFDPADKLPSTFTEAAERGKAPINERFARISSTDPKAEVNAPRLEWIRFTEEVKRADGPAVTAEMTSGVPIPVPTNQMPKGRSNSPEYHPEDLRAERWPELNAFKKTSDGTTKIPVSKAMDLIVGGLLSSGKDAKPLPINSEWDRPKESNGGQPTLKK